MNERERALAVLSGKKPDLIPWYADLAYWTTYLNTDNLIPVKYKGDGMYQLNRDLGTGFYL